MNRRKLSLVVSAIVTLLIAVGVAGAIPDRLPPLPPAAGADVSSGISYQGRLTGPDGAELSGTHTMRFVIYDDEVAGSALWDSGNMSVALDDGLFQVQLGVDQADFDGRALWLSIIVNGQVLSPRQELLPAPYALSLRPGAKVVGDAMGAGDAVLAAYAPATGTALQTQGNGGVGLFGGSQNNYGVWGASGDSWGGYFTSDDGYGIRVETSGEDHFDHGAYITSDGGFGLYAQSARNQAVRGEAGDVSGVSQPLGTVGVVGLGANRGTYGASNAGIGLYGVSQTNYGLWAQSISWRGLTGRTSRSDNNYGVYTPDNLYANSVTTSSAIMQVMQNGGPALLSPGDVVAFSGINHMAPGAGDPIVQVSQASAVNSTAVAGVVVSRFNIDAINPDLESPDDAAAETLAKMEVILPGNAAPGDYVLVVTHGPAQVKASALASDSIRPGDLLSAGSSAGVAGKAQTITADGVEMAAPGSVFAKALEPLAGKQDMIYVYVTLR